jgi:hypothetical protein
MDVRIDSKGLGVRAMGSKSSIWLDRSLDYVKKSNAVNLVKIYQREMSSLSDIRDSVILSGSWRHLIYVFTSF